MSAMVTVASPSTGEPQNWPSWFVWRWGQRFPEDIGWETHTYVHRAVIDHRIPHEHPHAGLPAEAQEIE